jgi:signal transduction histidine kinase
VIDRGRGILDADRVRLFRAFYRGRNVGEVAGTGLGLVIVKRCVDLHGGRIRCESREGEGATFIVTLPLFDGEPVLAESTEDVATASPGI